MGNSILGVQVFIGSRVWTQQFVSELEQYVCVAFFVYRKVDLNLAYVHVFIVCAAGCVVGCLIRCAGEGCECITQGRALHCPPQTSAFHDPSLGPGALVFTLLWL